MKNKNKYLINKAVINIKIPIKVDEYLKTFIFKNINMRRKIWNDFVEEANKYKDEYNHYKGFKPWQYKTKYYRTIEKPINRYEEYCVGLSEQVSDDMIVAMKTIKTKNNKVFNNKTGTRLGSLKFHKRNNCYGSFKVKTKNVLQLELYQRIFKCEECGYTIDRDMNASKNCYDFIS